MNVYRDVIERIEALGLRYYVTGSWALSAYGRPRQTADLDLVVDVSPVSYERTIRPAFSDSYLVNDPILVGGRAYGGVLHLAEVQKADLILLRDDKWSRSAMDRRIQMAHPGLGLTWLISSEDLLLAKLDWSEGRSEMQLEDARSIARLADDLDWDYVQRYAAALGVTSLLEAIRGD